MSKYYKSINHERIVKFIANTNDSDCFEGVVVSSNDLVEVGLHSYTWMKEFFEPYTPTPQELIEWGETATLSNDNPNKVEVDDKDINLRLKCLKLALQYQISNPLIGAQGFYDWITTNLIAKP